MRKHDANYSRVEHSKWMVSLNFIDVTSGCNTLIHKSIKPIYIYIYIKVMYNYSQPNLWKRKYPNLDDNNKI